MFDLSSKLYFAPLILYADGQPILTKSPTLGRFFFYINGLLCVYEARFIGLASGPQRQTTCLPVRGCFLVLVCLCVVVWVLFSIFLIFCITSFGYCNTKKESRNYPICHLRIEKGTRPAMVSGIITVDVPVIYWPIFAVPSNSLKSLCESDLGTVSHF